MSHEQVPGTQVPGAQVPGAQVPGVQVPGVQVPAVTSDVRAALQLRGARLGVGEPVPVEAEPGMGEQADLLLAPVFDDERRREIAHEKIEATLSRPRLRSLQAFLD